MYPVSVGYIRYSMSERAAEAYASGRVPASKVPGVPTELVRRFVWPTEWHHTSVRYRETDFFDPAEVRAIFGLEEYPHYDPDPEAVAALAAHRERTATAEVHENCHVEWLEWSGTRSHPRAETCVAEGATVAIKGQTATITLASGAHVKKRLATNGFTWRPVLP